VSKKNETVAEFGAIGDWAHLGCCWNPSDEDSILGVRAVIKEAKNKK